MGHFPTYVLKGIILLWTLERYLKSSAMMLREINTMKMQHFIPVVIVLCKKVWSSKYFCDYIGGHFRYTCVFSGRHHNVNLFSWHASLSDRCCEHCDGVVYKPDSIIETKQSEDKCQTVETSVCRVIPGIEKHLWGFKSSDKNISIS